MVLKNGMESVGDRKIVVSVFITAKVGGEGLTSTDFFWTQNSRETTSCFAAVLCPEEIRGYL
ncbi:MAG: hypothetical protein ACJATN_002668 [Neolewinella sp.]|jgi:hypothetical protein